MKGNIAIFKTALQIKQQKNSLIVGCLQKAEERTTLSGPRNWVQIVAAALINGTCNELSINRIEYKAYITRHLLRLAVGIILLATREEHLVVALRTRHKSLESLRWSKT